MKTTEQLKAQRYELFRKANAGEITATDLVRAALETAELLDADLAASGAPYGDDRRWRCRRVIGQTEAGLAFRAANTRKTGQVLVRWLLKDFR